MAKKTASTEMPAQTAAAAPAQVAPVAEQSAAPAQPRRVRHVKAEKPAEAAPAVAPVVVQPVAPVAVAAEPVVEATPVDSSESDESVLLRELKEALEHVRAEKGRLAEIGKNLATLVETLVKKTTKALHKNSKLRRVRKSPNPNSGFRKPVPVTDEFCKFFGRPSGSLISRTEVSKLIRDYIKENNLQNPSDRRTILPDTQLTSLLRVGSDEKLTYFTLQSKMNHLFVKSA